ncbi:hypothetical protein FRB99_000345, partial [Tulasnella sp. 403]
MANSAVDVNEVARIAHLASDIVINQEFPAFNAGSTDAETTQVIQVPGSADVTPALVKHAKTASLVSVNIGNASSLIHLLTTIPSLASLPVVINASYSDLGDALALRSS